MGSGLIPLILAAMMTIPLKPFHASAGDTIGQRAFSPQRNRALNLDYPDYLTNNDEENPMIVPKRAALLFDQLMVALQKAVNNQYKEEMNDSKAFTSSSGLRLPVANLQIIPSTNKQTFKTDLQRRGQANDVSYWRCYFNPVTCFKKK